ncbi:ABC transporter substrate-binding protein [Longirhabdus pacifica]|uniref:ABC transporter substrate-binding protein n=1 Tax=Longirhabdus pacifica TaxID=2305227 RepID=UPI0010092B63|nr:ABC transporter substrate-binding protein [Longirhabdus pacifica]
MKKRANVLKSVVGLLFIVMLAACGSGNTDSSETDLQTNGQNNANEEEVVATEEKSDKLVIYSAGPKGLAQSILEGFEASSGIKVEQYQATTGKVLGRLEAEKNNPVADVVVLASWPAAMGLKEDGMTQSYSEAKNADKLNDGWVDEAYHYFGYSASALGMTYNTNLVDEPPTDWSDLTGEQWKGVVNFPDPTLSGSALDFVSGYMNQVGEEGWNLFEDLAGNEVAMAGANKEALNPVITGAKSVVMAGVDYMAYSAKAQGEPIDIVYPASGTVINPRPAMILKDANNVENAKLFIDYLLSDEAQALVAEAYLLPGRADITTDLRANVGDIKVLAYDWNWMKENSQSISQNIVDIFN